ncbi:MAG: hypothetical protein NXI10_16525 [bacterium]|nr:hypothetical protein [bacterium]
MFPKRTYKLTTDKSVDEVLEAMRRNSKEGSHWFSYGDDNLFVGHVTSDGFKVSTRIGYKNDFRPQVSAKFSDGQPMLLIFRMTLAVRIILSVVLVIAAVLSVIFFYGNFSEQRETWFDTAIPLVALFSAYGMAHLGFWMELGRTKKRIEEVTEGKLR